MFSLAVDSTRFDNSAALFTLTRVFNIQLIGQHNVQVSEIGVWKYVISEISMVADSSGQLLSFEGSLNVGLAVNLCIQENSVHVCQ